MKYSVFIFITLLVLSCEQSKNNVSVEKDTNSVIAKVDTGNIPANDPPVKNATKIWVADIDRKKITPQELVGFAKTLIGIPYKYASTDPTIGFDCSGFITFVFNHFDIVVPRSSIDFTDIGNKVDLANAKEGDLILFTGTVDSIRTVGHMGIVTENIDTLKFIHSTSGRANSVTISNFTDHYKNRFVKVIRVFAD